MMRSMAKRLGHVLWAALPVAVLLAAGAAFGQEMDEPPFTEVVNPGDTAWMMTSSALVLLMTLPGLALFYGGLVRSKNVLSVLMQCMMTAGVITVAWVVVGYSIAFGGDGAFWGSLSGEFLLRGMGPESISGTLPTYVFVMFQLMFAIITPALMLGAFA